MASPDLTSHHVNYLIWRYLQESGLGEAAVMLQRAWNPDPQALPFAPYIKTHALVTLVQKGLQYHEIEQSLDQDGNPVPLTPSKYFFGPVPLEPEKLKTRGDHGEVGDGLGTDQAPASPASKVARDSGPVNGHLTAEPATSAKRARKSGGAERPEGALNGDEMEIEPNGVHEHASVPAGSPSPGEFGVDADGDVSMGMAAEAQDQEPAPEMPPTFTLTTGQSVGVQITPAKAADLSPDTAVLDVAGAGHVTRTLWRPHDSTVVAAAGDTFCSLWKLSSQRSTSAVQEKLVESRGDTTCVSTVAWDPTGQKLAVATYNDLSGSITMYDVHGHAVDLLPEVPRMITGLHWGEKGSQMVVVASDSRVSELALWDNSIRPDEFPPPQVIDGSIYDLTWLGDNQVYACGDGSVFQCDVDSSIHLSKTFSSSRLSTAWTFIRCAKRANSPVVVTASSETASIWIPTHDMQLDDAHLGAITTIELRPQPQIPELKQNAPIILASSSMDGTVKIWHIDVESKQFDCLHRLSLGPSVPALTSSFSPDGYAIAAASENKLFIWNAERGGVPMATWTVSGTEPPKKEESLDESANGFSEPMPDRSLSWDSDGKKLAFGFGNQMAIVNFQR
ncbi:hypothetical protein VTN00DRAFT_5562 [Thermoascus crustaceus]|uniref:uncharacterized protein n=1 Tax=Thermoascus crustaceus TaxID=5088 RepID=UPI003743E1D2